MSKFADFIKQNKIDPRRILSISLKIEHLRPEDRVLKSKKSSAEKAPAAPAAAAAEGEAAAPAAPPKPRSGRPVTQRLLDAVAAGKPVSGPQKTRLLRAVNRILEQKKKEPVDLRALF